MTELVNSQKESDGPIQHRPRWTDNDSGSSRHSFAAPQTFTTRSGSGPKEILRFSTAGLAVVLTLPPLPFDPGGGTDCLRRLEGG